MNQEMALRLGAVTGLGHARLIVERSGRLWGAFSVVDLFLLHALTLVTGFIGVSLALDYLGFNRTAVALRQLFFQRSYAIDKRVTRRFIA